MHVRPLLSLAAAGALGALVATSLRAQAPAQAPQVTVTGVSYLQYVYQLKDTANHNNNFDVTRAYINVLGRFSGGVSTRITADIQRVGAGDNSLRYRLKYAYVAYTPSGSSLTYKLGQIHTPWIDWEENLWDYRMQGQMALERGGYVSSSDFGLGVDGKWGPDKVNMQVGFYNGESYSGGTGDKRKDLMGRVSFRVMDTNDSSRTGGLRVTAYGQYGKPTTGGQRTRLLGMISYRSKQITLAGEYTLTTDSTTGAAVPPPAAAPHLKGGVASVLGVYHFSSSKAALIGRVDLTDPNTDAGNNRLTRVIAGASYQLSPNLRLLADVDMLSYQGGTPTPALEATRSQAYFQAQFTF